jgi:hypothetical protein
MIQEIITMLQFSDHCGISENVDIAKGKYKLHTSIKKAIKQANRDLKNIRYGRG